jgi:hypothetical protein
MVTITKRFHYVSSALPFTPPPWLAPRHHTTTPKLSRFTTPPSLLSYATPRVNLSHYIHRPPTPSSLLTTPALTVLHTHPTFLLTKKNPLQPQPHSTPAPFLLNNTIPPYPILPTTTKPKRRHHDSPPHNSHLHTSLVPGPTHHHLTSLKEDWYPTSFSCHVEDASQTLTQRMSVQAKV